MADNPVRVRAYNVRFGDCILVSFKNGTADKHILIDFGNAPGGVRGDGGLVSTASDYAAFVQMLLNEGDWHGKRLLKPETVRLMTSNQIGSVVVGPLLVQPKNPTTLLSSAE